MLVMTNSTSKCLWNVVTNTMYGNLRSKVQPFGEFIVLRFSHIIGVSYNSLLLVRFLLWYVILTAAMLRILTMGAFVCMIHYMQNVSQFYVIILSGRRVAVKVMTCIVKWKWIKQITGNYSLSLDVWQRLIRMKSDVYVMVVILISGVCI